MTWPASAGALVAALRRTTFRAANRRASLAMAVGALSSIGNFCLSVAVSHSASIAELGQFVLAFSFYALWTGLARAAVAESVLTEAPGPVAAAAGAHRASVIGVLAAVVTCGVGLATGSAYFILLSLMLPGLVLYDFFKILSLGVDGPKWAVAQEMTWTLATFGGVIVNALYLDDPLVVFGVWGASGAVIGFTAAAVRRHSVIPRWRLPRRDTKQALSFGTQFLVASGSSQLAMAALAVTGGVVVVGAVGAAKVVLGPVTLLVGTAGLLVIPYLVRRSAGPPLLRLRSARRIAMVGVVPAIAVAVACTLIPDHLGELLLGENWAEVQPLVPILAAECVLALASSVPFSGHRLERAGSRALFLGSVLGVVRVAALAAAGLSFGSRGAAFTMVLIALLSVFVWWTSYVLILRSCRDTAMSLAGVEPLHQVGSASGRPG